MADLSEKRWTEYRRDADSITVARIETTAQGEAATIVLTAEDRKGLERALRASAEKITTIPAPPPDWATEALRAAFKELDERIEYWAANTFSGLPAEGVSDLLSEIKVEFETALHAAGEAGSAGWAPIATAPKDGRDLILIDMTARKPGAGQGYWHAESQRWVCGDAELIQPLGDWNSVTHWQPMPSPPQQEEEPRPRHDPLDDIDEECLS